MLPEGLFIPDLAIVDAAAAEEDPVTHDAEAVLPVVEIVSPSSSGRGMDRLLKPPFYADAGIEHLWRLELEPVPALIVSQMGNGRYVERLAAEAGHTTSIEKPFPVDVDPGAPVQQKR
ncbi:Uma2 family endonuclease [Streptomyces sp. ME19-01-6]|uniref:Uma2 family endonuclease n=1 Tax=Streptomyces sp. ME19-01-6 TaxID=3028686 RepID=UPI0029CA8B19|nr:Uma2 family endonuclease [Streptomyces sp. ME19-01-6]